METTHDGALAKLQQTFGDRLRRPSNKNESLEVGALALVMPINAEEVKVLSEVATLHGIPLVPIGAGTAPGSKSSENGILVRFDLMKGIRVPDRDKQWVEAQPGVSWLNLNDELRRFGKGLAVYPTSAPRATVGGWLATDGLGVGSFEYGWLGENVLTASVVTPGGGEWEVSEAELEKYLQNATGSIVVSAKLRTRRSGGDVPFAVTFKHPAKMSAVISELVDHETPLWHLAFVSPVMAAARGLRPLHTLYGVCPGERDTNEWQKYLSLLVYAHQGTVLDRRLSSHVWGERFFPVAPSHRTPGVVMEIVRLEQLERAVEGHAKSPTQGTISRSGETVLVTLVDNRER